MNIIWGQKQLKIDHQKEDGGKKVRNFPKKILYLLFSKKDLQSPPWKNRKKRKCVKWVKAENSIYAKRYLRFVIFPLEIIKKETITCARKRMKSYFFIHSIKHENNNQSRCHKPQVKDLQSAVCHKWHFKNIDRKKRPCLYHSRVMQGWNCHTYQKMKNIYKQRIFS